MDKQTFIKELLVQNLPVGKPVTEREINIVAHKLCVLPESVDWGDADVLKKIISQDKTLSIDWGDAE